MLCARGCRNNTDGIIRAGQGLEGGVPPQGFALDSVYSCLSQTCVLVLCLLFQIKHQTDLPCSACLAFCLQPHISYCHGSDSAREQVNPCRIRFLSLWQGSFYLFVIPESLTLHFFLKTASLLCSYSDTFLIAGINSSLSWVQPAGSCLYKRGTLLLPQLLDLV